MRFRGPYHLFNSGGTWIGFCVGANLFNTDGIWCGWFPWEGSYDAVKPDGFYLGSVVGARLYYFERKQSLRMHKFVLYPVIPTIPNRPASVASRTLFDGVKDVMLKLEHAPRIVSEPNPVTSLAHLVDKAARS